MRTAFSDILSDSTTSQLRPQLLGDLALKEAYKLDQRADSEAALPDGRQLGRMTLMKVISTVVSVH